MKPHRRLLALSVAVAFATISLTGAASAGNRAGAESAAARAASRTAEKFGIFYPASSWKADCRSKGRKWRCEVKTDTGQCSGVIRLKERRSGGFKAYKKNIGCKE